MCSILEAADAESGILGVFPNAEVAINGVQAHGAWVHRIVFRGTPKNSVVTQTGEVTFHMSVTRK